mmetsp:Transcript_77156/g.121849  ORF Transcript_77156/g.121849 Transcript_77156/m.121849 type:complete len:89 (+) Transcript_77156:743-1009(+)
MMSPRCSRDVKDQKKMPRLSAQFGRTWLKQRIESRGSFRIMGFRMRWPFGLHLLVCVEDTLPRGDFIWSSQRVILEMKGDSFSELSLQ